MLTVSPSIRISPASMGWMPARHLMSVDLPAPLSPTSAITSPLRTSKSTSVSACTEPKDFEIPRSPSVGAAFSLTVRFLPHRRAGAPVRRLRPRGRGGLLAVLRVLADAHLGLLQE